MLEDVEFLYGKALYRQCEKVLKKAKQRAEKLEAFTEWLDLLGWERKLLKRFGTKNWEERLAEIIREKEDVLARTVEALQAHDLYDRIFLITSSNYHVRNADVLAEIQKTYGLTL